MSKFYKFTGYYDGVIVLQFDCAVNSAQFISTTTNKVREDELFMHKYFVQKVALSGQKDTTIVKEEIAELGADLTGSQQEEEGLDFAR